MRKLDKMILGLQVHTYAPELNKVVFKSGFRTDALNAATPEQYSDFFNDSRMWVRVAHITVVHTELAHKCCDRIYAVGISHGEYHEAMRQLRERHNLPDAQFIVKTVSKFI